MKEGFLIVGVIILFVGFMSSQIESFSERYEQQIEIENARVALYE